MKKIIYALLLTSIVLSSCTKEIIRLGELPIKSSNGIAGTSWKIVASSAIIDYGGGSVIEYDLFSGLPSCNTDNISKFLANGTTVTDEGNTKCNAADPQSATNGTWTLSNDQKKLVFTTSLPNTVGLTKLDCEVLQLNSTTMILRYTTYYNGPTSVTTTTYTKIN